MIGYKLTKTKALTLIGQTFDGVSMFNPVEINGQWLIFEGEVNECTNEDFIWVKNLTTIEINTII